MDSTNKKAPEARGVTHPLTRQAGHAPQQKPLVAQLKRGVSVQTIKQPLAPPVYRPQTTPKAAQPKMANGAVNRKPPVAPTVYRPQPVPKVLQTKSSSTQNSKADQAPRPPVAPPVYRPEAKKIVQPKVISQLREPPAAPPVYRPQQKRVAQPKMAAAAPAHPPPQAPPAYRPQPQPMIAQAGLPVQMKEHPVATPVPRNAAQVKPAAPVQMLKAAPALSHTPHGSIGRQTIQRTRWRYRSGAWVSESSSSSDTDPNPTPDAYCATNAITPGEHDSYDQQTGVYMPWATAREKTETRASARKRPDNYGKVFTAKRETTAYPYCRPRGVGEARSKPQGPHLLAHVTKRTVFDLSENMGLALETIIGSKLMPRPRQALQMLKDMLKDRNLPPPKPGALSTWYTEYKSAYQSAEGGKRGWKKGLKQAMELHPLTTYRVGEVATAAELAGKKEDAQVALTDIDLLLAHPRASGLPGGLTTVDGGYAAEGWVPGNQLREDFVFNYALAATGRPPSPSPYPEAPMSPPHDDNW